MREKILRIIRACELSEPILRYISINDRVVSRARVRIKWGVRISEGQIIRAILYTKTLFKLYFDLTFQVSNLFWIKQFP